MRLCIAGRFFIVWATGEAPSLVPTKLQTQTATDPGTHTHTHAHIRLALKVGDGGVRG